MAFLQIAEPGQSAAPHERKHALGIDLGTTNSLVATVRSGSAETLPDIQGRSLLPSVVHYREGASPLVGFEALAYAADYPLDTLQSVKRFMGRGRDDVAHDEYRIASAEHGLVRFETAAGEVTPVEASARILSALAERGKTTLGHDIDGVVITVPAYFDEAQRQATKDAATLAGLSVLRLLNEPTAAAVAYGLDTGDEGCIAVYDLGGGTFDVSILRLSQGVFEVLATGGDSALGGDDFDRALASWIQQALEIDAADASMQRRLLDLSRQLKEQLTDSESVEVTWPGSDRAVELTRTQFEALIQPLIKRTLRACRRSLRDAGLQADEIDTVVLVGGSTRIPLVRDAVRDAFNKDPLADIDPDTVVAVGAAIQADILIGNKPDGELLLLDVIPLSLGLETMGGLVEKVIDRNTTIPVARAQEFTTYQDGQVAMAVHVVQGERELVDDCRSLARFELRGIPPMVAGAARIRVQFQVDADGLLSVTAREEATGVESGVTVKPSYGLEEDQIADMLRASWEYAEEDKQARRRAEESVAAEQLLLGLDAALQADGEALLSAEEIAGLRAEMGGLESIRQSAEAADIKRATEALGRSSEAFAALRMDASIKRALTGVSLEELVAGDE